MLWAKLGVFAVVTFLRMLPSVVIAFFGNQAILGRHHILQISFSHGGVTRAVIGGAVYLMLIGAFALAIGAMIRNTAGGIATSSADSSTNTTPPQHEQGFGTPHGPGAAVSEASSAARRPARRRALSPRPLSRCPPLRAAR